MAGVRDLGRLSSALAMPEASFEGVTLHPSPSEMAAAYLYHTARNHPFVDCVFR
jgi:death-on-curing protein